MFHETRLHTLISLWSIWDGRHNFKRRPDNILVYMSFIGCVTKLLVGYWILLDIVQFFMVMFFSSEPPGLQHVSELPGHYYSFFRQIRAEKVHLGCYTLYLINFDGILHDGMETVSFALHYWTLLNFTKWLNLNEVA